MVDACRSSCIFNIYKLIPLWYSYRQLPNGEWMFRTSLEMNETALLVIQMFMICFLNLRHLVMLDLIHCCVSGEELQCMKFYKLKKWARTTKEIKCVQRKMFIYCSLTEVKLIATWAGPTWNKAVYHISFFDSLGSWFLLVCCLSTLVQVKCHRIEIKSNYLFGWK